MKTKKNKYAPLLLLLTAMIWGFAFVAQRIGADYVGPFTFNGIRFLLGTLAMSPVVLLLSRKNRTPAADGKRTFPAACVTGTILFIASALQQWGVSLTGSAGKSGFITGLYIVLVPVAGVLFLHKKTVWNIWCGAAAAVAGLYLLSFAGGYGSFGSGDAVLLLGAVFWTGHILAVDLFLERGVDTFLYALEQYAVCSVLNLVCAFLFEDITAAGVRGAMPAILYGGIMSVGVAYTLQILGQRDTEPAAASVILSLESTFSVIGGALFLHERMTVRGYFGCALIFAGILLSQLPSAKAEKKTDADTEKS